MLNENGITDAQQDEVNDLSIGIVDKLVEWGYVPDCTDTENEAEFEVQDMIRNRVIKFLKQLE